MSTLTLLTRREAMRLVASAMASNAAVDVFGQSSTNSPASQTIRANGIEMQITETKEKGGYVVHITFTKNGAHLFDARTQVVSRSQNETHTSQQLTDGHGFSYLIEVNAKQASGQSNQPPDVAFRVVVQQQKGEKQEFSGTIGSPSKPGGPPPLDKVMPASVHEQLAAFQVPIHEKILGLEQTTDVHVSPEKNEQPHVWRERTCHALCVGVAGVGILVVCGGTAGIGCGIATLGFLMAGSYCSDACPK